MSVWHVLPIWLSAVAGTCCIGFLMAGVLTLIREADEVRGENRPAVLPSTAPPKPRWWFWASYMVFMMLNGFAPDLPPHIRRIYYFTIYTMAGILVASLVVYGFAFGWRAKRDSQFCIKAAAMCALFATASGLALWRFN